MRILVLGASGMIGSAMFRVLGENKAWEVFGTLRSADAKRFFSAAVASKLLPGVDIDNHDALVRVFSRVQPAVVVNCIGLTKHHKESDDPVLAIPINALLPHRIAELCAVARARLIHVSTDCVFSGLKGAYVEDDPADARDVYGKTKFLGEVSYPHAVTLRTSTIGHELQSTYGLLAWFLSQEGKCNGFERAIFSGLPSTVFAQVVRDIVIPCTDLSGLYHVGAEAINKFELLCLIAKVYGKSIEIIRDESFAINRSLVSERFSKETGYIAPSWPELIQSMYASR
ncbi:MAG: SDR family oxidoreductase [Polaromonas sp.]|uniref:dTDP-4-dehydrorhamnose reductase family protein n=1 Tax=Polaromonas sp. TaxID=1869339 RepID=UPI002488E856|nr:SDR family oxidoreductase [Polaromonas sp.]MDI1270354.1 SDR family oxidoreductase [Polaromonas sp.]